MGFSFFLFVCASDETMPMPSQYLPPKEANLFKSLTVCSFSFFFSFLFQDFNLRSLL